MKDPKDNKKEFPGYPHYPAGEDITNKDNGMKHIDADPGNMGPNARRMGTEQRTAVTGNEDGQADQENPADVTDEDIRMLDAADQNRDLDDPDSEDDTLDARDDDGTLLNEARGTYGDTGADLDVPGSEEDDADEDRGEEDEENNYYSLGGDNHENLDEDNDI